MNLILSCFSSDTDRSAWSVSDSSWVIARWMPHGFLEVVWWLPNDATDINGVTSQRILVSSGVTSHRVLVSSEYPQCMQASWTGQGAILADPQAHRFDQLSTACNYSVSVGLSNRLNNFPLPFRATTAVESQQIAHTSGILPSFDDGGVSSYEQFP